MEREFMQAKIAIAQLEHNLKLYLTEINRQNNSLEKENNSLKERIKELESKLTENENSKSTSE